MAFDIAPPGKARAFTSPQDFISAENQFGASNYKPLDVVLSDGAGVWVLAVRADSRRVA